MNRLLGVLIAALAATFAIVWFNRDSGQTLGLSNDDFVQLMSLVLLLAAVGFRAFSSRAAMGEAGRNLAVWALAALALVAGYQYRAELQDIGNRVTIGLIPSRPQTSAGADGRVAVQIEKSASGHFEVDTQTNGVALPFLIDTGATSIVLTYPDAARIGIDLASLNFNYPVSTANGAGMAALARVSELTIGPIIRHDLRVLVAEDGKLDQSLLGMDYLNSLSGFSVEQDRLSLRD